MASQSMLKAVQKKRAYEDIVRQVITLIGEGKLKQGDQLPSERDLTKIFKVSRTTVREAIRTLESMKLLLCRQGMGTYVLVSPGILPVEKDDGKGGRTLPGAYKPHPLAGLGLHGDPCGGEP